MPCLLANPLRGRTCASYPCGTAIANPQGISRISPGASRTGASTAAARSKPAACSVMRAGNGRSPAPASRLIFTVIGRGTGGSPRGPTTVLIGRVAARATAVLPGPEYHPPHDASLPDRGSCGRRRDGRRGVGGAGAGAAGTGRPAGDARPVFQHVVDDRPARGRLAAALDRARARD